MVSMTAVGDSTRAPARAEHGRRLRLDRIGGRLILYLVLVFFFLIFFVPFIWIWSSALKTSIEIARDPFATPDHIGVGRISRRRGQSATSTGTWSTPSSTARRS